MAGRGACEASDLLQKGLCIGSDIGSWGRLDDADGGSLSATHFFGSIINIESIL